MNPHRHHALALAVAVACAAPQAARALPEGARVVRGSVAITNEGSRLTVRQATARAIVEWRHFGLQPGESFSLRQPGPQAALLARVTGADPSVLHGSIHADGRLYLINPHGVLIGPQGRIDTAGFVAATRDVKDDAFMAAGPLTFSGTGPGHIVNLGAVHARAGSVLLLGHRVHNAGRIEAPQGGASLLAADEVFLADPDAPDVLVRAGVGAAQGGTGVENSGLIAAAQARLEAGGGHLFALAVNQTGQIQATGVAHLDGRIVLTAGGGTVRHAGTLTAVQAEGSGGTILVGGEARGQGTLARADRVEVAASALLDASASAPAGAGGQVVVWADGSTVFAGSARARGGAAGGDGGAIEVSGRRQLRIADGALLDARAPRGRTGDILLDPDQITIAASGTDTTATGSLVTMSGATLGTLLAGGNVTLDTSTFNGTVGNGQIRVADTVSWAGTSELTLRSGNGIAIESDITAPDGRLTLRVGKSGDQTLPGELITLPRLDPRLDQTAGTRITVDTLRLGINELAAPAAGHYTLDAASSAAFQPAGTVNAGTLLLDPAGGTVSVQVSGTIGAVRTTRAGNLGNTRIEDTAGDLNVQLAVNGADGYSVEAITPGTLTLEAGSSFAFSAPSRDVVLASTAGRFVNQAGAGAMGANARFLIYADSPGNTTTGGLSGTNEFSRTFTGHPPSNFSGDTTSRFLYRAAAGRPELTYTADSVTRLYGDPNVLTYSLTGLQPGDTEASVTTGRPVLTTAATIQSGVGSYAIDITRGTLASPGYDFLFVPGTLRVNPAPLTIDIANATRLYGDANPAFSASLTGLKAGDTASGILAGWRLQTTATAASSVGAYPITADSVAPSANYTTTIRDGSLSVTPAPVTVSLAATSRTYGEANPDFRALATGSGLRNGDSVATAFPAGTLTTTATPASPVGNYAVTPGGTFTNPNYSVTLGTFGPLAVNKAPLTVVAADASRLYGDPDPVFGIAAITGFKLGQSEANLPGLMLVSAASRASGVGTYPIMPAGQATNYEFVAGGGTLTVQPAPLVVRIGSATRAYGDPDPVIPVQFEGLRNGEASVPGVVPVSSAGPRSPIGRYVVLSQGTIGTPNYLPTFFAGQLTVTPRALTVRANDASRTYGAENAALTVAVSNAAPWDAAQAAAYWQASSPATARAPVGSYPITVTTNPFGDRFDNLANYSVSLQPGTLTVQRAPLGVVVEPQSVLWGDGRAPFRYSFNGLMPWDTADAAGTVLLTSAGGGTAVPPGRYPITVAGSNVGANYRAELVGTPAVEVLRRPIEMIGSYAAPLAQLQEIHPGLLVPFTVSRYDSNGNRLSFSATAPLDGGPQFSVMASTDGTRGEGLGVFVGTPFIQPAAGTTLEEVLRYYDPTARLGTARATAFGNADNVLRNFAPPPPATVVVASVPKVTPTPPWPTDQAPTMGRLLATVAPDDATLRSTFDILSRSDAFGLLSTQERSLLIAARANESANNAWRDWIAESRAWIETVTREKPANWEALVASAEADIARWQAEIDRQPDFTELRRRAAAGDPQALTVLAPLMSAVLLQRLGEGTLPPEAEAAVVAHINGQRRDLTAKVDANYDAYLAKQGVRTGTLATLASGAKAPDLVGSAFIDLVAERQANAMKTTLAGFMGAGAGIIAGTLYGAAAMPLGATTVSVMVAASGNTFSNFAIAGGTAGVAAAPLVAVAFAVAVGVAEGQQVIESERNLQRYHDFKAANREITSLSDLDLKNRDNLAQAMLAVQGLVLESIGQTKAATP